MEQFSKHGFGDLFTVLLIHVIFSELELSSSSLIQIADVYDHLHQVRLVDSFILSALTFFWTHTFLNLLRL